MSRHNPSSAATDAMWAACEFEGGGFVRCDIRALENALRAGADVNSFISDGYTLLQAVCLPREAAADLAPGSGSAADVVARLCRREDLNINARCRSVDDAAGLTALHLAAMSPAVEKTMPLLLKHGARVRATDDKGQTPLHLAATAAAVRILVAHGADVLATDEDGNTPLHTLAGKQQLESVAALLESPRAAAAVNAANAAGATALHETAAEVLLFGPMCAPTKVAAALLAHGADAGVQDLQGQVPADLIAASMSQLRDPTIALVTTNAGVRKRLWVLVAGSDMQWLVADEFVAVGRETAALARLLRRAHAWRRRRLAVAARTRAMGAAPGGGCGGGDCVKPAGGDSGADATGSKA